MRLRRDRKAGGRERAGTGEIHLTRDVRASRGVFGFLWVMLFCSAFLVSGPWVGFHALFFGGFGLLILFRPSAVPLPKFWWGLAVVFLVASCAVFLPYRWFHQAGWRADLVDLGVATGSQVTMQPRLAGEFLLIFAGTILVGLWMVGHRASGRQVRVWALMFAFGVAAYAVVSKLVEGSEFFPSGLGNQNYGFFPNRNHTATFLSMGAICGIGCAFQAIRDKRFVILGCSLLATAICFWAVASWSVSRAGIVLVLVGGMIWLGLLGRRYLGRNGLWAVGLLVLTAGGLFFMVETEVRGRLTETLEKADRAIGTTEEEVGEGGIGKTSVSSGQGLDFRIPIFLDTLELLRDYPLTGIGAGQFYDIFPQYRKRTVIANDADVYHPESDWLWMAAETGVVATLALLILVILATGYAIRSIRGGTDRAIRAGCFVAALLVPLHGTFDVPGHRMTLVLSSVFLYVMSLQHAPAIVASGRWRRRGSRFFGILLAFLAAIFAWSQWFQGPPLAMGLASETLGRAQKLYAEDQDLFKQAQAAGIPYEPDPAEDKLERALGLIDEARKTVPLNRDLIRYEAFLALQFDNKYERVEKAFALERALDPTWVEGPLRQALAWLEIQPPKVGVLWAEALTRSRVIDAIDETNPRSSEKTLARIRALVRKIPELESLVPKVE